MSHRGGGTQGGYRAGSARSSSRIPLKHRITHPSNGGKFRLLQFRSAAFPPRFRMPMALSIFIRAMNGAGRGNGAEPGRARETGLVSRTNIGARSK